MAIYNSIHYIPVAFILGFFVAAVFARWWLQVVDLPWPTTVAVLLNAYSPGCDSVSCNFRFHVVRHMVVAFVLVGRQVSVQVGLLHAYRKICCNIRGSLMAKK